MFRYAISNRVMTIDPTAGQVAEPPDKFARQGRSATSVKARVFNLQTSKAVASSLHIHHQMAFWVARLTGPRISEVFGIRLGDMFLDEGYLIMDVGNQGGKKFDVRSGPGAIAKADSIERLKTLAGARLIPVAKQLAELVEVYVDAFHDPAADPSTPLVRAPRGLGQSAFRGALEKALADNGLSFDDIHFSASPHFYRKCIASDIAAKVPGHIRSFYLGHAVPATGGEAQVTAAVYTLQDDDIAQLFVVADQISLNVDETIGSLISPTPAGRLVPTLNGSSPKDRAEVIEVLDAAGLIGIERDEDGQEILALEEAAELLQSSEVYVRRLESRGLLERGRVRGIGANTKWGYTRSSVEERMNRHAELWTRRAICDELDIDYTRLRRTINALGILPAVGSGYALQYFSSDDVSKLREHFDDIRNLSSRATSMPEVAKKLGIGKGAVRMRLEMGSLVKDDEVSRVVGLTMVSNESVERLELRLRQRRRAATAPVGTISFREAQKRTGLKHNDLMALRSEGVVIKRTPDYQHCVDEASLDAYMTSSKFLEREARGEQVDDF